MIGRREYAGRCAVAAVLASVAALALVFPKTPAVERSGRAEGELHRRSGPSDSTGPPAAGVIRSQDARAGARAYAAPQVPAEAWIEAEIARAGRAPWRLYLERASDDEALFVERSSGGRVALIALAGGVARVLAEGRVPRRLGLDVLVERKLGAPLVAGPPPDDPERTQSVWARRRSRGWTVWLDGSLAFEAPVGKLAPLARTGFAADPGGPELVRLAVRPCGDPRFADDFMRERADATWTALAGSWELAGVRMPELSANPFALRARWPGLEPPDPFTEARWKPAKSGIGVNLSSWRGVVQIERITGNGPAALAGLREDDIVLAINDQVFRSVRPFTFHEDLEGPEGSEVELTILRPGELRPRKARLKRQAYRWAQINFGEPIPPAEGRQAPEGPEGREAEALAAAGESFWDGYRFETSVSCTGSSGGAGLAFAVRDAGHYHVFAAVGRSDSEEAPHAGTLSLVRVRGTERRVLAERPWRPRPGTWYRMAVELDGERISAFLDGAKVLEAEDRDLPAGRIGLWSLRGEGAYFDDVAVSTERSWTAPAPDSRAGAALAEELDMRRWANPSDEWHADVDSGWWREIYRFPGEIAVEIRPEAEYEALEVALGCGESGEPDGVLFAIDRRSRTCRTGRGGAARAEFDPARSVEFVLSQEGRAKALQTGKTLLDVAPTPSAPRRGDRVALRGTARPDSLGAIRVRSSGVREYHFRRAPSDWAVEAGRWGIMNKWICDPRFSWFGGHSRSLAAIWNKRPTRGDVTLDFYAALVMTSDDPPYERVGDFACTILGDGKTLSSGYTFIVSGGRNQWTRLYGAGRLLAESREAGHLLPSNVWTSQHRRALHQRWFRITLERRAARVRAMLDGREVFSLPDSLGLAEGYVALWTQDNGMLVGRARIAESGIAPRPERGRAAAGGEPSLWGACAGPVEVEGLTNLALGEISSRLAVDGTGPSGAPAVMVENIRGGGSFAAAASAPCDPRSLVSFDFRAEKGVRVDLYLEPDSLEFGKAGPFRVRLTGPACESERHPLLGGPQVFQAGPQRGPSPGFARADGRWYRVELDLGRLFDAYRAARAGAACEPPPSVTPLFACLEDGEGEEYLPAGIGGNPPGARYWVSGLRIEDPVRLDRAGPRVREVLLPGEKGTPEGRARIAFEDDISGVDAQSITLTLRSGEAPGNAEPGAARPGKLPRSVVSGPGPTPSTEELYLAAQAGPVLGRTLTLRVGGGSVFFDPLRQELEIDLAAAGCEPPLGEVGVAAFADRSGRPGEPFSRSSRLHADSEGPVLVALELLPEVEGELELDFEPGGRTWSELRERVAQGSPVFSLDRKVSVGGESSCRLTVARLASPFILRLFEGPAELSRLRVLSFDYRVPDQTPVNLVIRGRRGFHGVLFTDRDDPRSEWSHGIRYVGEIGGARADGLWRRASLELAETFRRAYPEMPFYPAQAMYLSDWGWNGLWPGDGYWLDNVRIEGVRRGRDLRVRWRAFDVSGVGAASWLLDRGPDTVPPPRPSSIADPARATVPLAEAGRLPDGEAFFHVRFADRAGNWSGAYHKRVFLDNTPPRVAGVEPADGTASPLREIRVRFEDFSGIDPSSLRLRVAGREYRVDRRACSFDAAGRVLTWSARGAFAEELLRPGARIEAELVAARDIVGNEMELPVRWSWFYDPSLDREAPPSPGLHFTTGRPYEGFIDGPTFGDTNDFERELGGVDATSGCTVELSREAARSGRSGVRARVTSERGGEFVLRLRERYWFADERPFFLFDLRVVPEEGSRGSPERLALRLDLFRRRCELELSPPRGGEWRRYALDLGEFLRRAGVEFPEFQGEPYRLAGPIYLAGRARPGTAIDIDDVELAQATWRGAVVEWDVPRDRSGIDGFAVAWDRSPATIPPEEVTHPVAPFAAGSVYRWAIPGPERYGKWFVHVRARDGSGNWGEASHLAVDLLGEGRIGEAE